jgi:hypothetical protein
MCTNLSFFFSSQKNTKRINESNKEVPRCYEENTVYGILVKVGFVIMALDVTECFEWLPKIVKDQHRKMNNNCPWEFWVWLICVSLYLEVPPLYNYIISFGYIQPQSNCLLEFSFIHSTELSSLQIKLSTARSCSCSSTQQYLHYIVTRWRLDTGFGLVIGFIGLSLHVTADNCNSLTDLHTLQITVLQHIWSLLCLHYVLLGNGSQQLPYSCPYRLATISQLLMTATD